MSINPSTHLLPPRFDIPTDSGPSDTSSNFSSEDEEEFFDCIEGEFEPSSSDILALEQRAQSVESPSFIPETLRKMPQTLRTKFDSYLAARKVTSKLKGSRFSPFTLKKESVEEILSSHFIPSQGATVHTKRLLSAAGWRPQLALIDRISEKIRKKKDSSSSATESGVSAGLIRRGKAFVRPLKESVEGSIKSQVADRTESLLVKALEKKHNDILKEQERSGKAFLDATLASHMTDGSYLCKEAEKALRTTEKRFSGTLEEHPAFQSDEAKTAHFQKLNAAIVDKIASQFLQDGEELPSSLKEQMEELKASTVVVDLIKDMIVKKGSDKAIFQFVGELASDPEVLQSLSTTSFWSNPKKYLSESYNGFKKSIWIGNGSLELAQRAPKLPEYVTPGESFSALPTGPAEKASVQMVGNDEISALLGSIVLKYFKDALPPELAPILLISGTSKDSKIAKLIGNAILKKASQKLSKHTVRELLDEKTEKLLSEKKSTEVKQESYEVKQSYEGSKETAVEKCTKALQLFTEKKAHEVRKLVYRKWDKLCGKGIRFLQKKLEKVQEKKNESNNRALKSLFTATKLPLHLLQGALRITHFAGAVLTRAFLVPFSKASFLFSFAGRRSVNYIGHGASKSLEWTHERFPKLRASRYGQYLKEKINDLKEYSKSRQLVESTFDKFVNEEQNKHLLLHIADQVLLGEEEVV